MEGECSILVMASMLVPLFFFFSFLLQCKEASRRRIVKLPTIRWQKWFCNELP